ncbi:MAG: hypothetical protein R3F22_04085 [Lysobacteraceae bacterium]
MSDEQEHDAPKLLQAALEAFQRGDDSEALQHCQSLLDAEPTHRDGLVLRANLAIRADDVDAGIDALSTLMRAHGAQPAWRRQLSRLFNRRGARYRKASDTGKARSDLRQALRLDADNTDVWFNLALCERDDNRDAEAANAVSELLRRRPDDEDGRLLAARLLQPRDPSACVAQLAMLRDSRYATDTLDIAADLDQAGDASAAAAYAEVLRLGDGRRGTPLLRAELGKALSLPAVVAEHSDLNRARERFSRGLSELETRWDDGYLGRAEPSLEQLVWCNFKLAYQGSNDVELQTRFGDLLQRPIRQWFPRWRDALEPSSSGERRVGLLSSCWRDCTVGHYFGGWIDWLVKAGYEVHLYQLGPTRDAHTDVLAAKASHFHFHDGDLASLAGRVREDRLHLLVYPEIGMDARLLPLASLRLARRQASAWGHPTTSGLPTIDAYFSCAAMEPEEAPSHYREELRLLPGIGVNYPVPDAANGRAPSLPDGQRVLLPHSLFKLHPDNDAVIAGVAARCPDVRFLLFRERFEAWNRQIATRLSKAFTARGMDAGKHLCWLPPLRRPDYLAVNRQADLMLDALHWSGGNTSLDALASGLPVVTSRGEFMRGRQTAAMLDILGVDGAIAETKRVAEMAASWLQDSDRREQVRQKILDSRQRLFGQDHAREAFLDHIEALTANR